MDKGENKVGYQFEVDRSKEAHAIEVTPTYMPDGYTLNARNTPKGGKWSDESTGGDISVYFYNAAELDWLQRAGQNNFQELLKDVHLKNMEISGMKTDVFVSDNFYTDSDKSVKNLYLFNEEYGYMVCVWSESNLPAEELVKIAEGLKVNVLDTVVPYASKDEIAKEKEADAAEQKKQDEMNQKGVTKDQIIAIGQEVENPLEQGRAFEDVRYTVEDVKVKDALSLDEYPAEYYVDYENEMAEWVDPDGTLKPHDRYWYPNMNMRDDNGTLQKGIGSKYVVVKMKAVNHSDKAVGKESDMGICLAPELTTLEPREDGNYSYPSSYYYKGNENYHLQWSAGMGNNYPVYIDKMYHTEGIARIKDAMFRPLEAGEELEYTLIYIMDEDRLDQMYLEFYPETATVGTGVSVPYVKLAR